MLKDIFQDHNKDIFTDELVGTIQKYVDEEIQSGVNERMIDLNDKYDKKLEDLETKIGEMSEAYEAERNELEMAKVEAMEKWLEEVREELFEAQKIDYENVAVVKEAIEIHRANLKLQEKYNMDTSSEKMDENTELAKIKADYNSLFDKSETIYESMIEAKRNLTIFKIGQTLETETDRDKLLSLSESINADTPEEFETRLQENAELMFGKKSKKIDEDSKDDDKKKDDAKKDDEKKVDEKTKSTDYGKKYDWWKKA